MKGRDVKIQVNKTETVSAIITSPDSDADYNNTGVVIAHGAANDLNHPVIVSVAEALAEAGITSLRFNFLYREKGKKSPDSEKRLTEVWLQVYDHMKKEVLPGADRYIAAGKSLGGRIVSQAVSEGKMTPDALIFLGYPLHAPGRKENLKDAHLYTINCPMLFIEGTRDPFCDQESFKKVYEKLACDKRVEWIEGGNHSYDLPASAERTEADVFRQVSERCVSWIDGLKG